MDERRIGFFFSSRRRHTRFKCDWSSDVCSSDLAGVEIRVRDRGPGITQERQAELFTRFSTFAAMRRPAADRPGQPEAGRQRGGLRWRPAPGFGLYFSCGIIEAHASHLRFNSNTVED